MKRIVLILILILMLTFLVVVPIFAESSDVETIEAEISSFDIMINADKVDNAQLMYPFITYNNITYIPMEYKISKKLGLELTWNEATGVNIQETESEHIGWTVDGNHTLGEKVYPTKAIGKIKVSDIVIDNETEKYPILIYNDIYYLPLTESFIKSKFHWYTSWDKEKGLSIETRYEKTELDNGVTSYSYYKLNQPQSEEVTTKSKSFTLDNTVEVIKEKSAGKVEPVNTVKTQEQVFAETLAEDTKIYYMSLMADSINGTLEIDLSNEYDDLVLLLPSKYAIKYKMIDPNAVLKGVIYSGNERIKILSFDGPTFRVDDIDGGRMYPAHLNYGRTQYYAYEKMNVLMDKCQEIFGKWPDKLMWHLSSDSFEVFELDFDEREQRRYSNGILIMKAEAQNRANLAKNREDYMNDDKSLGDQLEKYNIAIPRNKFKLFTFNMSNNYITDRGDFERVVVKKSDYGYFLNENDRFGGYCVGNFYFNEKKTQKIMVNSSFAEVRLLIDGKLVDRFKGKKNIEHEFEPGKHKIELEIYLDHHYLDWSLVIEDLGYDNDITRESKEIMSHITEDTLIDYVCVSKAMTGEKVDLFVTYAKQPRVLFLNSTNPLLWHLDGDIGSVEAIVVGYRNEGAKVLNAKNIPVYYFKDLPVARHLYLLFSHEKFNDYQKPYNFETLNNIVMDLTNRKLDTFTSGVSFNVNTNEIWLTKEKYKEIEKENKPVREKIEAYKEADKKKN